MSKTETETITEVMGICSKCDKIERCFSPCPEANKILQTRGFEYKGDEKMTGIINKCPHVVQTGIQNGEPYGTCRFYNVHKIMCPLISSKDIDEDITCFDLPEDQLRSIMKYPDKGK